MLDLHAARRLGVGAGLLLAVTLTTLASPVAVGAPTSPPISQIKAMSQGPNPGPQHSDVRRLSAWQKGQVALGTRLTHYAINKRTKTMDYRYADRYDQGHVTFRRQLAADYLKFGGHISHISAGELHRVRALMPKGDPYRYIRNSEGVFTCKGRQGFVVAGSYTLRSWTIYMNSCTVSDLMFIGFAIIAVTALLAGVLGIAGVGVPLAIASLVVSAVVSMGVAYVAWLREHSSKEAIYVREHYFLVWAGPQP